MVFRRDVRGGREFNKGGFVSRNSGPKQMHDAVCGGCGKNCQVPFRPTGEKPVYCRECFASNGGGNRWSDRGADRFPKREFTPRPQTGGINDDSKRQFEILNVKLDKLITAIQSIVPAKKEDVKKAESTVKGVSKAVVKVLTKRKVKKFK